MFRLRSAVVGFALVSCASVATSTRAAEDSIQSLDLRPKPAVLTDRAADGTLWALGSDWKMRFAVDRTIYHPRFGARAPRTPSLDVTLVSVRVGGRFLPLARPPASELSAGRVEYDRGVLTESWILAPDGVEQTFVLDTPPPPGDMVFEFGASSDLVANGSDDAGLRFTMPGVGEVRYGHAAVIDSNGNRTRLDSEFVAGRLQLRIPHEVLVDAAFPIVVDPLIKNLAIDIDSQDEAFPDAAWGLSSYLVVYERIFSSTDSDIVSRRLDENGVFLDDVAVDVSSADTIDPAVAAHGGDFLIVWNELGDGLFSDNVIRGRRRIETTGVQAAAFDISSGRDETKPDVGATPNLVSRPFFVVWTEDPLIGGPETHGRAVDALGNDLGADVFFGLGDPLDAPRISKSAGLAGRYVVTWVTLGTTHRFLDAQMVSQSGSKLGSLVVVQQNLIADELHADVDGDGTNWAVVREARSGDLDIQATFLVATGASTLSVVGSSNLSTLAHGSAESLDQRNPAVGSEGTRYTIAWSEPDPTSGQRVVATSYVVSNAAPLAIALVDGPATHGKVADFEYDLGVVSTQFDEPGEVLLTWARNEAANVNQIEGALRTSLLPGGVVATVPTGCGSPEPLLITGSSAAVGGGIQFLVGNASSGTVLLVAGTPAPSIPFCSTQAPDCKLGVNVLSVLTIPTVVSAPIPSIPGLIGFTAALQAIDVLPSNATGTFCGPPKYTQKFRVSDTIHVKFQ